MTLSVECFIYHLFQPSTVTSSRCLLAHPQHMNFRHLIGSSPGIAMPVITFKNLQLSSMIVTADYHGKCYPQFINYLLEVISGEIRKVVPYQYWHMVEVLDAKLID